MGGLSLKPSPEANHPMKGLEPLTPARVSPLEYQTTTATTRHSHWRRARATLGRVGVSIVLGGSLTALVILGFLLFLWLAEGPAGGAYAPTSWRWIVVNDYLSRAVTLSAAFLRIIVVLQIMMSTSLIAAILLEGPGYGVPLAHAAELSVTRGANSGPFRLAYLMYSSSWLRKTARLPVLLTVLLVFLTVASQFLSTLLISDLRTSSLVGFERTTDVYIDRRPGNTAPVQYYNYLGVPPVFVPFGEFTSPADSTEPSPRGLSDTGLVQRVFLPMDEVNRTTVRSYVGEAYVLGSRYACLPPTITSATLRKFPVLPAGNFLNYLTGSVSFDASLRDAGVDLECPDGPCFASQANFSCSMPFANLDSTAGPKGGAAMATSLCTLDRTNGGYTAYLNQGADYTRVMGRQPVQPASQVYLFFRTNFTAVTAATVFAPQGNITFPAEARHEGEFLTWEFGRMRVSVSVCFQSYAVSTALVAASADRDLAAPAGRWDFERNTWDTSALLPFFGVAVGGRANASARGVYRVDAATNLSATSLWIMGGGAQIIADPAAAAATGGTTTFFGPHLVGRVDLLINDETAALVSDVLAATGRPALALQTLGLVGAMNSLALPRPKLDRAAAVAVVHSAFVPAPREGRGLLAAAVVVLVSLLGSGAVAGLFLRWTAHTYRGDYWHAVAQLASDDVRWLLDEATAMADGDVARLLGERGERAVRVRRGYDAETGRDAVRLVVME